MAELLQAALEWAARGFRVFPLRPNGKRPCILNFPAEATDNPEKIRAWWSGLEPTLWGKRTDYNIGVSTTGIVVVDVDMKGLKNGLVSYEAYGGEFDTLVVQTPSGGYHCYFRGPDSRLSAGRLGDGLDIRSHHGYAIAPGSTIGGHAYRLVVDRPMAYVPPLIHCNLEPPNQRRIQQEAGVELDTDTAIANAIEWLKFTAPFAIEGQGGNDTTYRVACRLVRDFALSDVIACKVLEEHWNDRCIPPWNPDELFSIVEHAGAYGVGPLGAARPEATFGGVHLLPVPAAIPALPVPVLRPQVGKGNALRPEQLTARPWLVKRLLLTGEASMVAAAGAAGKSTLTLAALAHFAVGLNFGTWELQIPGMPICSVIYNAEDSLQEQCRKLYAICQYFMLEYDDVVRNIVLITKDHRTLMLASSGPNGTIVQNEEDVNFVVQTAIDAGASIISFDPLTNLHACNENDPGQMNKLMQLLTNIVATAGCAGLVFHHTVKDSGKDDRAGNANIARGSGATVNSTRITLTMTGATPEDMIALGIDPKRRSAYVRVQGAKESYSKPGEASLWLEWHAEKIMTGDSIGIVKPFAAAARYKVASDEIALEISSILREEATGAMSLAEMIRKLREIDPFRKTIGDRTMRDQVIAMIGDGVTIDKDVVKCQVEMYESRSQYVVKLI